MKRHALVYALVFVLCFSTFAFGGGGAYADDSSNSGHEPIVMQAPFRNIGAFIDVLHEEYPEINLEVEPYSGANYTAYVTAQLAAGDLPDIYCTTIFSSGELVRDNLIDMSGYDFSDNYAQAHLRNVTDEGAIYMLPTYYECIGITYNKTLLEKHGWTLPTSFKELEELAVKVEEAGCNLALSEIQLPGYGFQYLCNILDTGFLNTLDGHRWQRDFLSGNANVKDTPEMIEDLKILEKWRDLGMLNNNGDPTSDNDTRLIMAEGNTLFLLGSTNVFKEEETTDEFAIMPYLSEDGSQNTYVLNVSRYVGLNKHLQDAGNEQKLEDALNVMRVLSTVRGMQTLNSVFSNTSLLPLKDYDVNPNGYYAGIEDALNTGKTAPMIYSGWENLIVPIGNVAIDFIKGEAEISDLVAAFDDNQNLLFNNDDAAYTTVAEKIDMDGCARLVGICFAKASGADIALISKNRWYKMDVQNDMNLDGVSGALYPLPVTDQEIVSILPTGWRGNIKTVTFTGKRIKELLDEGYDRNANGLTFPYELVTPEGFEIDDDKVYTVAICGATEAVAEEGNMQDTGILGLDAMREYLSQFDTLSNKDIIWE